MADFNVEMKAAVFDMFEGPAPGRHEGRQGQAKDCPAPDMVDQPVVFDDQRQADADGTKSLGDQIPASAAALVLPAAEHAAREVPLPDFAA
eukprot:gene12412-16546_t